MPSIDKSKRWKDMTDGDRLDAIIKSVPDIDSDDAIYLSERRSYRFVITCLGDEVL